MKLDGVKNDDITNDEKANDIADTDVLHRYINSTTITPNYIYFP